MLPLMRNGRSLSFSMRVGTRYRFGFFARCDAEEPVDEAAYAIGARPADSRKPAAANSARSHVAASIGGHIRSGRSLFALFTVRPCDVQTSTNTWTSG